MKGSGRRFVLAGMVALGSAATHCAAAPSAPNAGITPGATSAPPRLSLVESYPEGTSLDHPDIPDAAPTWLEMLERAKKSVDLGEFYVTSKPGESLEPILEALGRAADRGAKVRLIVDSRFAKNEHETLERLEHDPRFAVRRFDVGSLMGGVQHAKYFIVDGREAFVGSQNLDWRSLSQIQELGVRVSVPEVVRAEMDVFETDWNLAGGGDPAARTHLATGAFPAAFDEGTITPVFSPKGFLPDESLWELPRIVKLIDGARRSVRVQLLTYTTADKEQEFTELDEALRRAGARGVKVELLVSDWAMAKPSVTSLKALARSGVVAIRFLHFPEAKRGFIPYARVAHAKYMVVDASESWVGSSNWERRYFYGTRNAGVIVESARFGQRLDRFFEGDWNSPYASAIDVDRDYEPPRTH